MAAAEDLARCWGARELGITVGLFDAYGPAQRLYARRGYLPDGHGACQRQRPLRKGMHVTIDDDLIIWLTTDLRPPALATDQVATSGRCACSPRRQPCIIVVAWWADRPDRYRDAGASGIVRAQGFHA